MPWGGCSRGDDRRGGQHRLRLPHAIDHKAVRVVQRIDAVAGDTSGIEHNARRAVGMPADPDLTHDVVVDVEAQSPIDQSRHGARRRQIEEHAHRIRNAFVMKAHFGVEFDGDANGVGKHRTVMSLIVATFALGAAEGRSRVSAGALPARIRRRNARAGRARLSPAYSSDTPPRAGAADGSPVVLSRSCPSRMKRSSDRTPACHRALSL